MDVDRKLFAAAADPGARNGGCLAMIQPYGHAHIGFGRAAAFVRIEADPAIAFDMQFGPAVGGMPFERRVWRADCATTAVPNRTVDVKAAFLLSLAAANRMRERDGGVLVTTARMPRPTVRATDEGIAVTVRGRAPARAGAPRRRGHP